ncbi:MAG: hypothetical protein M3076_11625 [Actinomycetota bacterium]|nr:hypothetical protein [Actinomycetota bacterium]
MSQSTTIDSRQPDLGSNLDANAGAIRTAAQGDFARGQRHDRDRGHIYGDFATGMRTTSTRTVTGDFATGIRSSQTPTTFGDFATGMRIAPAPVTTHDITRNPGELPLAA